MILAILWVIVCPPDTAFAKIYKYKDDRGKTHFTDDPNTIPFKHRNQDRMKSFKGVVPPPDAPSSSSGLSGSSPNGTAGGSGSGPAGKKDEGLSPKEIALVNKTIVVLQTGVALADRYKDSQPSSSNGRGVTTAIQGLLPAKEGIAMELGGTQVPELKEVMGFLKTSIALDKESKGIGGGLKTRIMVIMSRVQSEGQQQSAFIKKLEKALKDSEKKKAEAKKKKDEEAKKKK